MVESWWTLQAVVVGLWLLSAWAVRAGGAHAGRVMRWIAVGSVLLSLAPLPQEQVTRLVPLMSGLHVPTNQAVDLGVRAYATPIGTSIDLIIGLTLTVLVLRISWIARRCRASRVLRRVGNLRIALAPVTVPQTVWLGRHWILLDATTAADPSRRDLAVRHELQHIRNRDTVWSWFWVMLTALCAPNPAAWWLVANLRELDEHAVDRTLVHQRNVPARTYGQLLLDTAAPAAPLLATGLSHHPLHRRLQMLSSARPHRVLPWILASLLLAGVATARPAGQTTIDSERIVALDARDHRLVREAHHRLTEGGGSRFFREAMERRPGHEKALQEALLEAGLPVELEAIVLIESGYDDQRVHTGGGPEGAGLWMFIPSTARTYGLTVDDQLDERLDAVKETQAAIALLSDLYADFGDWGLALAAYNQGPKTVREAMRKVGSKDVLTLVEEGELNRYVPMVWAGMLTL